MSALSGTWRRVPVVVRAVIVGVLVAAAGTTPWAWLAGMNLRHFRAVPWDAAVMAPYLWLYWLYASGRGWPRSTSERRRQSLRARPLDPDTWAAAMVAGVLGIATSLDLMRLLGRLVALPHEGALDLAGVPTVTVAGSLLMAAIVAGVVEEASFRGYMQRPIERRHGPVVAILVASLVFGLAHGSHSYFTAALLPFYAAIGATYGAIAWITDSILPCIALHAGSDFLDFLATLGAGGGGAWERTATGAPAAAAGPTGVDAAFFVNLAVLTLLVAATVWAYRQLALTARRRAPATSSP